MNDTNFFGLIIIGLVIAGIFASCGRHSNEKAEKALIEQGYKDIKINRYQMFACGRSDDYNRGFEATSNAGYRVKGVVCMGVFKGSTIRTF